MATINAYRPQPAPLMFETAEGQRMASGCIEFGGWHHRDNTLTPIQLTALLTMPGNPGLSWAMDSLAAAAEAGILDGDRYVEQLFASKEDVRAFRYRQVADRPTFHCSEKTRKRRTRLDDLRWYRRCIRPSRVSPPRDTSARRRHHVFSEQDASNFHR
jgi:hypothetical protein